MGKFSDWLGRFGNTLGGDAPRSPRWDDDQHPHIAEERGGRLYTPGRAPLDRDPIRPIEIAASHLSLQRADKLHGVAWLRNTTIGRAGWDEAIDFVEFDCYPSGGWKIVFGILEADYAHGTSMIDTWWVQCEIPADVFDRIKTASALNVVCTADMWRSGPDWKLARTVAGPIQGRGTITSLKPP